MAIDLTVEDDDTIVALFRNNLHPNTPLEFNQKIAGKDRFNGYLLPNKECRLPGWVYKNLKELGDPIYGEKFIPERNEMMSVKIGSHPRFSFDVLRIIKANEAAPPEPSQQEVKASPKRRGRPPKEKK